MKTYIKKELKKFPYRNLKVRKQIKNKKIILT